MNITTAERQQIETALDDLMLAVEAPGDQMAAFRARRRYLKAIAIVRDRPADVRRVRSDFGGQRRPRGQSQIPTLESA